jgi:uncharacterized membrane protein
MERRSLRAVGVPALLLFLSALPIVMGVARFVEVPSGALPPESTYLYQTPWAIALHGLSGAAFGLLGPLQFWTAFRNRFGRLHRLSGRIFVLAGVVMGLTGLRMIAAFALPDFDLTDLARALFSPAMLVALWLAVAAIRRRDLARHRAWMIRAYALGIGQSPIAFVFFPMFLITGIPPAGLTVDLVLIGTWLACIGVAEAVIRLKLSGPVSGRSLA